MPARHCRSRWAENPHVHMVDLDFVTGSLSQDPTFEACFGGLGPRLMLPEVRTERLEIAASASLNQAALYRVPNTIQPRQPPAPLAADKTQGT